MSAEHAPPRVGVASIERHIALAGLTAAMLGLSFPRPGWGWLAYIALVPLGILAVRTRSVRRLAWTAYLVFFIWWLVMLRWLIPVTVPGYAALCALMAAYTAAAPVLWAWLHRRYGLAMTLAIPLGWVSLEFVRGHVPQGGFAWFFLAHTQAPFAPGQGPGRLIQVADLLGEPAVSFLVAMTSGLIVDLLTQPLVKPGPAGGQAGGRMRYGLLATAATAVALLIGAWGYGQFRISQAARVLREGLRVAVIQTNVPQDNKNFRTPQQQEQDWRDMLTLTQQAAAMQPAPDLIVWPETMAPAPLDSQTRQALGADSDAQLYHQQIQQLAKQLHTAILVGSHAYADWQIVTEDDGQAYLRPARRFNSVYLYTADGSQSPLRYDKIHRVPFGEYIPWIDASPWLFDLFLKHLSPYSYDYSLTAGRQWTRFALQPDQPDGQSLTFVTPICFEDTVGRVTRRLIHDSDGRKQAQAIINLTNSAWYPDSDQQLQHLQIAVLRSIENRVPTARSVNYGISGFIDPLGRIGPVVQVDGKQEGVAGVASATLWLDGRATLFGRVGRWPAGLMTLLTALLALGGLFRRDRIVASTAGEANQGTNQSKREIGP